MTPHETPPRELLRAVATVRWLLMRWRANEIGIDFSLVNSATYYAIELTRDWLNDNDFNFTRTFDESNNTPRFLRRFRSYLFNFHENRLAGVYNELRRAEHEIAKLKVYETLPFNAPRNIHTELNTLLHKARVEFARYWHFDDADQQPPAWTYEQMKEMLETRTLIEVKVENEA